MSHNALVHSTLANPDLRNVRQHHAWVERSAAFGIDVATFVLAAPVVLGLCAVFLREYWAFGTIAVVAAYTMGSWVTCGQTLGMSLAGIHLVDERSGRNPSVGQVLMRAALTLPPLVGGTAVLNAVLAPETASLSDTPMVLAIAAVLVGLLSSAWALVDDGRMLHDRLCGLRIVRADTNRVRAPVR